MIRYKVDVLKALKDAGYSTFRIRRDRILGCSYVQQLRKGELCSWATMEKLCALLGCQISDLVEYVPDREKEDIP